MGGQMVGEGTAEHEAVNESRETGIFQGANDCDRTAFSPEQKYSRRTIRARRLIFELEAVSAVFS
jgi:hypothetical protein